MLLNRPCAFIDIETTGTHANSEAITEVGLRLIDTTGEVISWQQLINPGKSISGFIQQLTGISNTMVADQPYFQDIAGELWELLESSIFVAHNARFDYSFIKKGLEHCGYDFKPKTICTVKLSRALYPEFRHHNLDEICKRINYQRETSHRAMADVDAMLAFVQQAIADHGIDQVNRAAESQLKRPSQPCYIDQALVDNIPNTPGVYRFYDGEGALLYVGKSVQMRDRVKSHFSADLTNAKEMAMAAAVRHIEHTETYGELGALLLENQEIKNLSPIYNRRQRRHLKLWTFEIDNAQKQLLPKLTEKPGYCMKQKEGKNLNENILESIKSKLSYYGLYTSKGAAEKWYKETIDKNGLCKKILGLEKGSGSCFNYQIKRCDGACVGEQSISDHNRKVVKAFASNKLLDWTFDEAAIIIEESENWPTENEPLCAYHVVDQWAYIGTVNDMESLQSLLDQMQENPKQVTFDRETYRFLNRYIHLAKPVSEVLVKQEMNIESV